MNPALPIKKTYLIVNQAIELVSLSQKAGLSWPNGERAPQRKGASLASGRFKT